VVWSPLRDGTIAHAATPTLGYMRSVKIGIAITRAGLIDVTWTTAHLAAAALSRGHQVRFVEPWDYEIDSDRRLVARAHAFNDPVAVSKLAEALQERTASRRYVRVDTLDLLMLRAAPLDLALLTFAMLAQELHVPVVNDPDGLLRVSHKAWLASLVDVPTPAGIVTRSRGVANLFYEKQALGAVVKPARGSGGRAVARVDPGDDSAFDEAFAQATKAGDGYVVVQEYLVDAQFGEKRLVWMDGEILGGYIRQRAPGEFRHNLKRGGVAAATEITAADRAVSARIGPHLLAHGIRIAGLDVIGSHLIEVNALNPGGTYHTDRLSGTALSVEIIRRLEDHPTTGRTTAWAPLAT
jgi:glutathione synthase